MAPEVLCVETCCSRLGSRARSCLTTRGSFAGGAVVIEAFVLVGGYRCRRHCQEFRSSALVGCSERDRQNRSKELLRKQAERGVVKGKVVRLKFSLSKHVSHLPVDASLIYFRGVVKLLSYICRKCTGEMCSSFPSFPGVAVFCWLCFFYYHFFFKL